MHILIGAVVGAIVGAVVAVVVAKATGSKVPLWEAAAAGAVGGAASGAIITATLGTGGLAASTTMEGALAFAAGGAVGGASQQVTTNALEHRPLDENVGQATAFGAATGAVSFGIARYAAPAIEDALPRIMPRFGGAPGVEPPPPVAEPVAPAPSGGSSSLGASRAIEDLAIGRDPGAEGGPGRGPAGGGEPASTTPEPAAVEGGSTPPQSASGPGSGSSSGPAVPGEFGAEPSTGAPRANGLTHLTSDRGYDGITSSGKLRGSYGIFALEDGVADDAGSFERVARTGISPENTANEVRIPENATPNFRPVRPIGPYSLWKWAGGTRYAPPGEIDIATGEFTPTPGAGWKPIAALYGPDAFLWAGAGSTLLGKAWLEANDAPVSPPPAPPRARTPARAAAAQ